MERARFGVRTMESCMDALDAIDRAILRALVEDSRQTHAALSARVPLSPTACARRVKRLEDEGFITGYTVGLDAERLGCSTTVSVRISLDRQSDDCLRAFERAVAKCPSVVSCFLMSGGDDYLLSVCVTDLKTFERVHNEELSRLPCVARIQSSFAMREIIRRPIPAWALAPDPR